jgi:signal transduction histidine kinase
MALFRIAQEALTNVARHAAARRAAVEFREEGRSVVLTIEDDGTGFEEKAERLQTGYGLTAMRERAEAVGGTLEVRSEKGRGTRVTAKVPAA